MCTNTFWVVFVRHAHTYSFNLNHKYNVIHVDFEIAIHNVLKEAFPEETIKCCIFHLGQAWQRKIQTLGLCQYYKKAVMKSANG